MTPPPGLGFYEPGGREGADRRMGSSACAELCPPPPGVEIVIGTPGRLADLLAAGATTLTRVTMVILDEVDQVWPPAAGSEPSHARGRRETAHRAFYT